MGDAATLQGPCPGGRRTHECHAIPDSGTSETHIQGVRGAVLTEIHVAPRRPLQAVSTFSEPRPTPNPSRRGANGACLPEGPNSRQMGELPKFVQLVLLPVHLQFRRESNSIHCDIVLGQRGDSGVSQRSPPRRLPIGQPLRPASGRPSRLHGGPGSPRLPLPGGGTSSPPPCRAVPPPPPKGAGSSRTRHGRTHVPSCCKIHPCAETSLRRTSRGNPSLRARMLRRLSRTPRNPDGRLAAP